MREAKVLAPNGMTVQIGLVNYRGKNELSDMTIQVPEELHETEDTVAYIPAKSIWLNADAARELRLFLNEMYAKGDE